MAYEFFMLPVVSHQRLLQDALDADAAAALEGTPLFITFRLRGRIESWISEMSVKYRHPKEEVTEIIVQLGRYIDEVYPRARATPRVPYFWAVVPVDYLTARWQLATSKVENYLMDVKTLTVTVEKKLARLGHSVQEEPTPSLEPTAINAEVSGVQKVETSSTKLQSVTVRKQHLAGELVHYLYYASQRRDQTPEELLIELGYTALYLDSNFPDRDLSSLREQLLVKVLAAERMAREINQVLSALETQLVDAARIFESVESAMLNMFESDPDEEAPVEEGQ